MRRGYQRTHGATKAAGMVGLRGISADSLEGVERRRLQLWILFGVLLVSVSVGFAFMSPPAQVDWLVSPSVLRTAIVLLAVAFCAYAFEKEFQLRRLSKLLMDERVLTAALTSRLHEVSVLLDAGKAMNSQLELPPMLESILGGAVELLEADSGSIMLREGDDLVCTAAYRNDAARGSRSRIGDGIARGGWRPNASRCSSRAASLRRARSEPFRWTVP